MGQVLLFLLGTVFLTIVYGRSSFKQGEEEFRVVVLPPGALAKELNALKADHWELAGFSAHGATDMTVLLKRTKP